MNRYVLQRRQFSQLIPPGQVPPLRWGAKWDGDHITTISIGWFKANEVKGWKWWSSVLTNVISRGWTFEMDELQRGLLHLDAFRIWVEVAPIAPARVRKLQEFVDGIANGRRPPPVEAESLRRSVTPRSQRNSLADMDYSISDEEIFGMSREQFDLINDRG